jgi:hypothetical protein
MRRGPNCVGGVGVVSREERVSFQAESGVKKGASRIHWQVVSRGKGGVQFWKEERGVARQGVYYSSGRCGVS